MYTWVFGSWRNLDNEFCKLFETNLSVWVVSKIKHQIIVQAFQVKTLKKFSEAPKLVYR